MRGVRDRNSNAQWPGGKKGIRFLLVECKGNPSQKERKKGTTGQLGEAVGRTGEFQFRPSKGTLRREANHGPLLRFLDCCTGAGAFGLKPRPAIPWNQLPSKRSPRGFGGGKLEGGFPSTLYKNHGFRNPNPNQSKPRGSLLAGVSFTDPRCFSNFVPLTWQGVPVGNPEKSSFILRSFLQKVKPHCAPENSGAFRKPDRGSGGLRSHVSPCANIF